MYPVTDKNLSVVGHDDQTDQILKTISSIRLRFAIIVLKSKKYKVGKM